MPVSITPELGFEVSIQNSKDALKPPQITSLSPQEIVDILQGKTEKGISIIDPRWFVESALGVAGSKPVDSLVRKARRAIVFSAALFSTS
jgi:hypothetical protein